MCGSSSGNGGTPSYAGNTSYGGTSATGGEAAAGGGGGVTTSSGGAPAAAATITIQNNAFSPLNLTVAAGATVTVMNMDTVQHSVTSETAKGNFQPGAVNGVSFDTGNFTAGTQTFTITASATAGTVVPYYCRVHTSSMTEGTLTIQ
jgi:plastocyanin